MKFGNSLIFLFFVICETTFYLTTAQTVNEEKNDCTKFYNFIRGDNVVYSADACCSEFAIQCENGYITNIFR